MIARATRRHGTGEASDRLSSPQIRWLLWGLVGLGVLGTVDIAQFVATNQGMFTSAPGRAADPRRIGCVTDTACAGCARRLWDLRPERRNGCLRPNQEPSLAEWHAALAQFDEHDCMAPAMATSVQSGLPWFITEETGGRSSAPSRKGWALHAKREACLPRELGRPPVSSVTVCSCARRRRDRPRSRGGGGCRANRPRNRRRAGTERHANDPHPARRSIPRQHRSR